MFDTMVPHAVQIADPFLVELANSVLDEFRRRVQNETCGHHGGKTDPLYRIRKLMTIAPRTPRSRQHPSCADYSSPATPAVRFAPPGTPKIVVREISTIDDPHVAAEFVSQPGIDLQVDSCAPEVQRLGRTIVRWRHQLVAWHHGRHTNGPTEATLRSAELTGGP